MTQEAKNALKIFLRGIPENTLFNIVSFGSKFESLFREGSQPYNDETLERASLVLTNRRLLALSVSVSCCGLGDRVND